MELKDITNGPNWMIWVVFAVFVLITILFLIILIWRLAKKHFPLLWRMSSVRLLCLTAL